MEVVIRTSGKNEHNKRMQADQQTATRFVTADAKRYVGDITKITPTAIRPTATNCSCSECV